MALTRLDNLYSSKTGKYLYVSPDDFNATDELDNRGNSPLRPFKTIQRAFIEVARYSYVPGSGNDRFDQFSIMLMPGNHYIDNRPGLVDTTSSPEFSFDAVNNVWTDNSILDLSNSDNVLYKFNATTGGAIVPRGCSLVGYDLRRTIIRPLYVPDPVDKEVGRTSIFNLTGGCYLWQFTIKDGDLLENSPLYDSTEKIGKVYTQPDGSIASLKDPQFSHHKICIMEYAENKELDLYYEKVGQAFSKFQPTIVDDGELDPLVQENRIVGPLSDSRTIDSLKIDDIPDTSTAKVTVTTKIEHGYFDGQYVAVLNTGLDEELNGTFKIYLDNNDPKVFSYTLDAVAASVGLTSGNTYDATTAPNALGANAISLAEIDSVESASPYVFNCSIRSTWGQCGMWANGSKATGFRSMVVAQYTGVSLQKDDRAFIRYDRFTNTWNQASLNDAFATVPYHTKGDAYWKDDWRNFHIRASDDSFIQCVSVFAVGFFDHFLMESGGDMSITNSNSNFGNTSLHAVGHKGYAFNQDKGGYITDIIPPRVVSDSRALAEKVQYYTFDVIESNDSDNHTRLYLGSDGALNPEDRPAATIGGYRIGARTDEKIYVRLDALSSGGNTEFSSTLSPSGFRRFKSSLSILNPLEISSFLDNYAQDAANSINNNKEFIQNEAYAYIIDKYPTLDPDSPSFKGGIDISKCRRDIGYIVDAVVTDLRLTLNTSTIPSSYNDTSNINVIQAAEAYYVGGQLDYIENELNETLEAWDYVKNLCIAAMRNWDYMRGPVGGGNPGCIINDGSDLIDVGDTTGLLVGMTVEEYAQGDFTNGRLNVGATPNTDNIPSGAFISKIENATTIRIANNSGPLVADGTNNNAFLHFDLTSGYFDTSVAPTSDDSIVQDTAYPECGNVSLLIQSYFDDIDTILNGGTVVRRESKVNTNALATRATIFTLNIGDGSSNPHNLETGTPVRLVPRAKDGTNPDKRLIRLPLGFNTNQKYYVIAPGRKTYPEDYSTNNSFNGSDGTKLMLATSPENAAAGIYIFSPETDTIDTDVEIDIYQFVLDDQYDLHKYVCNIAGSGTLETDVSHVFDLPVSESQSIPQKVFFRAASDITGSSLPILSGGDPIDDQTFFYARYVKTESTSPGIVPQKQFSIHSSFKGAVNNNEEITFQPNSGSNFYVFCDKRESPLRFDPEKGDTGIWYLNVKDESSGLTPSTTSILYRIHQNDYDDASGKIRTTDSWFERLSDRREKEDRAYRFRYVIPKYLEAVRDPLNGFVMKIRTDDKRRLVPQRLLLKPKGSAPDFCELLNPGTSEILGLKSSEYDSTIVPSYDPYVNPVTIETSSKIAFNVQSARKVNVGGTDYLEITVFDHQTINASLKGKLFYVLKITEPQGGTFIQSETSSTNTNYIEWTGNCSGNGYIQSVIAHEIDANTTDWYMILKDVNGTIEYDQYNATTFAQQGGTVTTTLAAKPDSVGDPDGKSKSLRDDYLYAIPRAGVYTAVPGDTIEVSLQGGGTGQYYIDYVQDNPEIEDTFYIFDIDELQERIAGQQDGIYYLTAVRGNISPFPQGPGVGTNFRNFKFSQPISQLYPLDYKNDPLWFKNIDSTLLDPPATVSAADNYVHGLVTVNDYKNSETKESTIDFIQNLGEISKYEVGGKDFGIIEAQEGNATSGAEDRKIPIFGNQDTPSASKLYVELRRPSIARSGNHTFEYLGFGPGNYSTGFPLRQEVVLSDKQDFYAQAKREDGGIVFYTGLNSNGDLYIGNRKINAITGEETFLEAATLESSEDDSDDLGSLVTTFETPVTFQDKITVEGDAFFNNPVLINTDPLEGNPLTIQSNVTSNDDVTLDRSSYTPFEKGDIVLGKNQIKAAVLNLTPRGLPGFDGQPYTLRTHFADSEPSNITPNQNPKLNSQDSTSSRFANTQLVFYGTSQTPDPGDVLLKGSEVGKTGSLGWIYATNYENKSNLVLNVVTDGTNKVKINWIPGVTNVSLGVNVSTKIRISFFTNPSINGTWEIDQETFDSTASSVTIKVANGIASQVYTWVSEYELEVSNSVWKETGVIGSEAIRTSTDSIGNYKVGINTIASANHSSYLNAYVDEYTEPRANLDVIGTAWITGRTVDNWLTQPNGPLINRTVTGQTNAFMVGGDRDNPNSLAVFRVDTLNNKVGINVSNSSVALDKELVVAGEARITDILNVDSGVITSTNSTLKLGLTSTIVDLFPEATSIDIGNDTDLTQSVNIGNVATSQTVKIGDAAVSSIFYVHKNSENSVVSIGQVGNGDASFDSKVFIGGAFSNKSSLCNIRNFRTKIDGDIELGTPSTGISKIYSFTDKLELFAASGGPNEIEFARSGSILNIGADAGTTTINNSLYVKASERVDGNITLFGGLSAGEITADRGSFNTTPSAHGFGGLDDLNVDIYKRVEIGKTIDTQGAAFWGGNTFIENPITSSYYLPVNEIIGTFDIAIGDYLLIDREESGGDQSDSEIVLVVSLINATDSTDPDGYRIEVLRAQEGTTLRTDHPDNCVITKLNKQANVSYTTSTIPNGSQGESVDITTAEFGGSILVGDILRIDDNELFTVTEVSTDSENIQALRINDGGEPPLTVFEVLSTTGQTTILGPTEVRNDITLTGSTSVNDKLFTVTNGTDTRFQIDSSSGNTKLYGSLSVGTNFNEFLVNGSNGTVTMNGGDINIFANDGTTPKLTFTNGNGNLKISGLIETEGTGENLFAGDITLNGGDLTVNSGTTKRFKINNNGNIDLGGIDNYISSTGARKWLYLDTVSGDGGTIASNVNYFVKASSDLVIKLPETASTGDSIRFVDIGGALTYNVRMIIRAPDGVPVAGDSTNTGITIPGVSLTDYDGGELIVTTPNAAFGLVYAGATNADGSSSGVPSNLQGWWLMEI